MNLSVIIPWKDRPVIGQTLRMNAHRLAAIEAEVLVVNGGGDLTQLRELMSASGYDGLRLIEMPDAEHFNKCECLNIGAFFSQTEYIFVLDADIILTTDFLGQALNAILNDACFVSVAEVTESEPETQNNPGLPRAMVLKRVITTELLYEDGRRASIEYAIDKYGTRTGPGLVLVKKEDFIAVGGFNGSLQGWGYEDYDFQIRLQLSLGLKRMSMGRVQHISHARAQAAGGSNARNAALCKVNYEQGKLNGTFLADVSRWKDRAKEGQL